MKKLLAIIVAILLVLPIIAQADVRNSSKRMDGINTNLIGIVSDEYSDILTVNPANLLDIEGYRLYTNLSNLINSNTAGAAGTETYIDGADYNEFMIGGVMPLMDIGNIGAYLNRMDAKNEGAIIYADFDSGVADARVTGGGNNAAQTAMVVTGIAQNGEYDYENVNTPAVGQTITAAENGTSYNTLSDSDINVIAATSLIEAADLGLRIRYNSVPNTNKSEADYEYSFTNSDDADDYASQEFEAEMHGVAGNAAGGTLPTFNQSGMSIQPALKTEINDITLGVTLSLNMMKGVQDYTFDTTIMAGENCTDPNFLPQHSGIPALTDPYERTWKYDQTLEVDGTGIGLGADVEYPLNKDTKIKGLASYQSNPLSGSGSAESTDSILQDGLDGDPVSQTMTQDLDYDRKNNVINVLGGIEKMVSRDLLLGIGLGINVNKTETEYSETNGTSVDVTDGDAADPVYSNNLYYSTDQTVTTVVIPVGLEWTATKWLKARMGSTYQVTSTKSTGELKTETVNAATGIVTNTTTTETSPAGTAPKAAVANFFSGVGFMISENLCVDVTNLAGGGTILALNNWRMSATLMF
ncbi:MAG: hypothetical protein JXJ19_00315 [Elusimicrobia bacterium]|nr:hypothetical protein [Elusimicrobiota bacterium]